MAVRAPTNMTNPNPQLCRATGSLTREPLKLSAAPFKHLGGATMSNWPLRGGKAELWEGGVRGVAFLYGGALPASVAGQRSPILCHATDWYRTFARLAGASLDTPRSAGAVLYGVEIWSALLQGSAAQPFAARDELLHNVDPVSGQQVRWARAFALANDCSHADGDPLREPA